LDAALHLLWRFSVPASKQDEDMKPTEFLIRTILSVMSRDQQTFAVLEASCGILANLAIKSSFPIELTPDVFEITWKTLSKPEFVVDKGLAPSGMHLICNLLSDSARRELIMSEREVVRLVIDFLSSFTNQEELLELGCQTIAYLCSKSSSSAEIVINEGGLECLAKLWQTHVLSKERVPLTRMLEKLSRFNSGARKLVESNLLNNFSLVSCRETDDTVKAMLQSIIRNAIKVEANGFSSSYSETLVDQEQVPSDDLYATTALLSEDAIERLLLTMDRCSASLAIQLEGCGILADTYFSSSQSHFESVMLNVDGPEKTPWTTFSVEHHRHAISTIRAAMRKFRSNDDIQYCACYALSNLLVRICNQEGCTEEIQAISVCANPSLNDVMDAFDVSPGHPRVSMGAVNLFWVLSYICYDGFLKIWTPTVLDRVLEAMVRFRSDKEMCGAACALFLSLKDDSENLKCIGTARGVSTLLVTITCDDEYIVTSASGILANLLANEKVPSGSISEIFRSIGSLNSCMVRYPSNAIVQTNVCSIIESIIALEDYDERGLLDDSNVYQALCDALVIHASRDDVVLRVCRTLACFIPAVHDDILLALLSQLCKALWQVLNTSLQKEDLSSVAVKVLWTLCKRDICLRQMLTEDSSCTERFVRAMKHHLGDSELQINGCRLISSFCEDEHAKQVIGDCGGVEAVINSLLAHAGNAEIQREGLPAMRKLATCAENKPMIANACGETAISYALLIHYRSPCVLSEAFSALRTILTDLENGKVYPVYPLSKEEMRSIIIGMRRFAIDGAVQQSACRLMNDCSFLASNLDMMKNHRSELFPLLLNAAHSFPGHCRESVSAIFTLFQAEFPEAMDMEPLKMEVKDAAEASSVGNLSDCIMEGERDTMVNIEGLDEIIREELVYLRCKIHLASQVAHQRLGHIEGSDPRFSSRRFEGSHEGFILVCSRLYWQAKELYVHSGQTSSNRELVVIKKIDADGWSYDDDLSVGPLREAWMLKMLKGKLKGVAGCKEILHDDASIYLVLDFPGLESHGYCTLDDRLPSAGWTSLKSSRKDDFDENNVKQIFREIIELVQRLHNEGVCLGNLCSASILDMGSNGVFLDNFGGSFLVSLHESDGQPVLQQPFTAGIKGSYISPELYRSLDLDGFACDVWSLGATLFALLTGSKLCDIPDENDRRFFLFIHSGGLKDDNALDAMMKELLRESSSDARNSVWSSILRVRRLSRPARDLLSGMLKPDPQMRLTLSQVLSHDWMIGVDENREKALLPFAPGSGDGSGSDQTDHATSHGSGGRSGASSSRKKKNEKTEGNREVTRVGPKQMRRRKTATTPKMATMTSVTETEIPGRSSTT
jgi:serine/threonine protein kinase